jgi:tRNA pseudouridine32 synthase/23S rRNA pseudouridine746 synthase
MTQDTVKIIYQDQHLIVADKPAGLLSVPGRGPDNQHCLFNQVLKINPNARIAHRLDQGTSGMVIFPLSYLALRNLTKSFEDKKIRKTYLAVVDGLLEKDEGEIDLPLICDWPNRPLQKVCYEHGKKALTRYQVINRDQPLQQTRIHLFPITGRTHQLRVHMLSIGHTILGDGLYASPEIKSKAPRLLLHAQDLAFPHPITNEEIELHCKAEF